MPPGFTLELGFLSANEEHDLLDHLAALEFSAIESHGVVARRRAAHFGMRYDYTTKTLGVIEPIPMFLLSLREKISTYLGIPTDALPEVIINEYTPGAAIGWHRDAPVYETIVGISVGSECTFKVRPIEKTTQKRKSLSALIPPRSLYIMTDDVRWQYEHSVLPTPALRYSITFRTLK